MTPALSLSDAITATETANTAFTNAQQTTGNDQSAAAAIQAQLDAANAQVAADQTAQTAAGSAFNSALDGLIAAATAAKVPTP